MRSPDRKVVFFTVQHGNLKSVLCYDFKGSIVVEKLLAIMRFNNSSLRMPGATSSAVHLLILQCKVL